MKMWFYDGCEVSDDGSKGGLFLAWKEEIQVELRSYSSFYIDVKVYNPDEDVNW